MSSKTSTPSLHSWRFERRTRWLLVAVSLAAAATSHRAAAAPAKPSKAHGALRPCPTGVPAAIDPPPSVTLTAAVAANGVQIYACSAPKPGEAPAWTLEGPHATLTQGNEVVGIHFAGPAWQALDGSSVKGAKLAAADAPAATAVPWLLLSGTATGDGTFGQVTHVQRLETTGGKPPSIGCDTAHLGAKVLVPYTSSYFFYRPAAPGENILQCRSTTPHG